jgi:hypothetical protein
MNWQRLTFMFRQVLVVISCCRRWRVWMAACCAVGVCDRRLGACAGARSARVRGQAGRVSAVIGSAEETGERADRFEQQSVEAGLLVGGVAGAELGDRAAVVGLGGELADPGGDRGAHVGRRRDVVSRG